MPALATKEAGFWEVFTRFPPYYVRLLARKPGRGHKAAVSDAEIAIAANLPITRVREISRLLSWDSVPHGEILAYTSACNFDPTSYHDRNREKQYRYICAKRQSVPFKYLRRHPKWESEFLPLVKLMMGRLTTGQASSHA